MEKKRPVIIDFVGQSGAGKTYVKNELLKYLSVNYTCFDFSDCDVTLKDYCDFVLTAPKTFIFSLALILFNVPKSYPRMFNLLKKWFNAQVKTKKASVLNYDFVLNDEGLFKRFGFIRNLTLRKVSFDKIPDSIRKNFLYPSLTILVTADFDLSEQRKKARVRDAGNKEKLREGVKKSVLKNLNNLQKDLLAAERLGLMKVVYYNNDGQFDISLLNTIQELCLEKTDN